MYKQSLSHPPSPASPVFPVRPGAGGDRHNLGRRLAHVVSVANEMRARQGLAALPARITPHTFRRTFITPSFQAGKDLVFVQSQAGHADWKTTLDIYTQQSSRSVNADVRHLLQQFLGEGEEASDASRRASLHARREVGEL